MTDQEITFTLYKKQETEPFIKVSYKDSNNDPKEIQLTGDANLDSINMVKLFSESLSADFINDYKSIKSNHQESNDTNKMSKEQGEEGKGEEGKGIEPEKILQPLVLPTIEELEKIKKKLKNSKGTLYSGKLPIADIVSVLSTDTSKITKFNEKVVSTLLKEFSTLKPNNYNKYIKKNVLSEDLQQNFESGINADEVKTYILNSSKIDMSDQNIISEVFTDEFLNKYSKDITKWGREILVSNGGNSSQKIRNIHNKTHRKK